MQVDYIIYLLYITVRLKRYFNNGTWNPSPSRAAIYRRWLSCPSSSLSLQRQGSSSSLCALWKCWATAVLMVFFISICTVIGPTPPSEKKQVIAEILDLWVIGSIARTDGPADSRDIIGSWWRDIQRRRRVIGDLKRCCKSNYVKRQTVIWMWTKWVKE